MKTTIGRFVSFSVAPIAELFSQCSSAFLRRTSTYFRAFPRGLFVNAHHIFCYPPPYLLRARAIRSEDSGPRGRDRGDDHPPGALGMRQGGVAQTVTAAAAAAAAAAIASLLLRYTSLETRFRVEGKVFGDEQRFLIATEPSC